MIGCKNRLTAVSLSDCNILALTENEDTIHVLINDALLLTEENKNVIFGLSYFSESFYLVRHIFSESGLFDLHDHFGNLVRQIRHIKSAKRHFDLSCTPLFLKVASTRVV